MISASVRLLFLQCCNHRLTFLPPQVLAAGHPGNDFMAHNYPCAQAGHINSLHRSIAAFSPSCSSSSDSGSFSGALSPRLRLGRLNARPPQLRSASSPSMVRRPSRVRSVCPSVLSACSRGACGVCAKRTLRVEPSMGDTARRWAIAATWACR
ncbi:hypothetical protein DFH27DRAFT_565657 [Peziza echinospora]|nr:hypothetical protein DFH27DRAFT_565657 [Peziza echinospora]